MSDDSTTTGINRIEGEENVNQLGDSVSREFKFSTLCEYLDRIRRLPTKGKFAKQRVFESLMARWTACGHSLSADSLKYNASFFGALRLIVNAYDTRKFRMKSKKLIGKVCKALLLPNQTKRELMQTDSKSASFALRQLAKEIAERNPSSGREFSVFDVNESLSRVTDAELSEGELSALLRGCASERELFWLMHILVRNVEMCLGLASSVLLNWVHARGGQLQQSGTSLERICALAALGKADDESSLLFRMFEPMLLSKIKHGSNVFDKLVQHCGQPFYVQLKFDGEHFLVHRRGDDIRYYSRNQNDFTSKIAPSLDSRILPFFAPAVQSCILDTELLLWDVFEKNFVGKGKQASDGRVYDAKALRGDGAVEACLAVFDVLFLNGRPMLDVPLERRIALLHDGSILQHQERGTIFVGDASVVNTREEFVSIYEKAMRDEEEGVVVKKIDSLYRIGVRHMVNGWFKVKPFHLGEESLDLAVVGVDLGRNGVIENYAVAVLRDEKFFIVGKVSRGMDNLTRKLLRTRLEAGGGWLKTKMVPDWIHEANYAADRTTDYVRKENIQVVEVKAAGILNARLHFPTIRFYRDDKLVKDIDKYEDFLDFERNLRTQSLAAAGNTSTAGEGRKRTAAVAHVMEEYRVKRGNVRIRGEQLKGMQICVVRGSPAAPAQKLREIVESFGGTYAANPGAKTKFVISGEPNHMKTKSVIKGGKYDVVDAAWAIACEHAARVVPIKRSHALHVVNESLFALFEDDQMEGEGGEGEEGDVPDDTGNQNPDAEVYTEESVRKLLDAVEISENAKRIGKDGEKENEKLRDELCVGEKFTRFVGERFALHDSLDEVTRRLAGILLKVHGATVVDDPHKAFTHLVVSDRNAAELSPELEDTSAKVVDIPWIESAVDMPSAPQAGT